MRIISILLIILITLSTVAAQDSECAVNQLAYVVGNRLNAAQIRIIDSNLENDRILFDARTTIRSIDWSPSGEQLVFAAAIEPVPQSLMVINADGTNPVELVAAPSISKVAWSPDGEWLAYLSAQKLYLIRPDGSTLTEIPIATTADDFAWSPDSNYFAVEARDQNGISAIYLVNLLDMTYRQISDNNLSYANNPNWIGNALVTFSSFDGIFIVDPFAEEPESVIYQAIEGGTLTFWENTQVGDAIILHDGDVWHFHDDELVNLTNDADDPVTVGWSADGQYIVYSFIGSDGENTIVGIKMLNLETGQSAFIHNDADMFDWQPC